MSTQLLLGAAMVATALPVAWLAVSGQQRNMGTALRRSNVQSGARAVALTAPASVRLGAPAMASLSRLGRRTTPASMLQTLEDKLGAAGMQASWTVERLLAAKVLLALVGGFLGFRIFASDPSPLMFAAGVVLAFGCWYIPDFVVSKRVDERRRQIQHALPDTMDQLTIAVEAGLGFESALAHVAAEGEGPLAEELRRTMQDIQLGMTRADALDEMAARTGVSDLSRFLTSVRQAGRYGLPIADVLRAQSAELRERRRQRAEEHAQKIPVKVLFPLVLFILPTLFIVVLGPGIMRFLDAGGIGGK